MRYRETDALGTSIFHDHDRRVPLGGRQAAAAVDEANAIRLHRDRDPLSQMLYVDARFARGQSLTHTDKMSMACPRSAPVLT
jgi:hypothetical protein